MSEKICFLDVVKKLEFKYDSLKGGFIITNCRPYSPLWRRDAIVLFRFGKRIINNIEIFSSI